MTEQLSNLVDASPLPPVTGDKRERGSAVIVAGSEACPGAAVLAATAALRVGVGRVQIITTPPVATSIAIAVPESYVIAWAADEELPSEARAQLEAARAVLVGPGLGDDARRRLCAVAAHLAPSTPLLVDALALAGVPHLLERGVHPVCLPNADEARELTSQLAIAENLPLDNVARAIAERTSAPCAVRGEETFLSDGSGIYAHRGPPSLGTAGSGDVLSGAAVGLVGRGISPLPALGWAIAAHSASGRRLDAGRANPGYLARELVDALPDALDRPLGVGEGAGERRSL